jgi:hypothetical protein
MQKNNTQGEESSTNNNPMLMEGGYNTLGSGPENGTSI